MSAKTTSPVYRLTLRTQPRWDDPDGIRRLKSLLKLLKRSAGFDCIECIPVERSEGTPDKEAIANP